MPRVNHPYGKDLAADLAKLTALSDSLTYGPEARLHEAKERIAGRRLTFSSAPPTHESASPPPDPTRRRGPSSR